jgi:hypothetical protein
MLSKWLNPLFNRSAAITCHDTESVQWNILEICEELKLNIKNLEDRIIKLEDENVDLINQLYRLENSLEERINILGAEKIFFENVNKTS